MNVLAELHHLIGSYKKKRGQYNTKTLTHLQQAQSLSGKTEHLITYAYLLRDITGYLPQPLLLQLIEAKKKNNL